MTVMKRIMICTLAVFTLTFVSCKGGDDNKAEEYIDRIYDAIDRQDFATAVNLYKEMRHYLNSLDDDTERKMREQLGAEKLKKIDEMEDILYQGCKARGIPFGPDEMAAQEAAEEEAEEAIEEMGVAEPWEDEVGVYPENTDSLGEEATIIDTEAGDAVEEHPGQGEQAPAQTEDDFRL